MTQTASNQPQPEVAAPNTSLTHNWGEAKQPLPLGELAQRASHFKWLESKAFELTGRAITQVTEPDLKLMLNRHSLHHGWHAQLWHNHIPETPAYNPTRQAVAPTKLHETFMAKLSDVLSSEGASAVKLVGLYRVLLPYALTAYAEYAQMVSPITEAAVARSLRLIQQDKLNDWQEGEAALQRLVANSHDLPEVSKRQFELETILSSARGFMTS